MRIHSGLLALALSPLTAWPVSVGDTYAQVIEEKGKPATKLEAGDVLVLTYPGQRIKLKGGKVTELKNVAAETAPAPAPAPAPARPIAKAPAPAPAPTPAAPGNSSIAWSTDFQASLARARKQQTRLFLFFTGSDWCSWCQRLDAEILSTNEFNAYASQKLILVKLDFPRNLPQSDEEKTQNSRLARRYKIAGYPTVIVLNPNGQKVGELGYQKGGPGPFIEALSRM